MVQITAVLAAAFAGLAAATCGNDCVRNVGATRFGPEIFAKRMSDCAAFLETTVTVAPTRLYSTVVVTIATSTVTLARTQVVPEYATKCSLDTGLYSSACLCNTASLRTVTATPTVTQVVEIVATTQIPQIVYQGA
ncbi:hypothetical protein B0I35DRAFT_409908 [Stachybotrys elegans]|uniref:Uncharacterized protein n=1 Tax=Stachybotrys elegans TaxID=80388 RepID=A0A8K0WQE4_9HYPO|nr:hypothetical protein B0I35DRAFT_409908 [Stachybotrys elegans]